MIRPKGQLSSSKKEEQDFNSHYAHEKEIYMGLISSSESDGDEDPTEIKKLTTIAADDGKALATGLEHENNDHHRGNVSESDYQLKQFDSENKRNQNKT